MSKNLFYNHAVDGSSPHELLEAADQPSIDSTLRLPVIILFGNAIHWLVVASFLSVIVSLKLVFPSFLGGIGFFSYGRLAPVARDLMLYGWALQAGLATGLWLMAKLCDRTLVNKGSITLLNSLIISATVIWNLAVLLGSLSILAGYSTGVEWLEYPNWASAMLFLSYLLIAIWGVLLFERKRKRNAEVAQWYLVAGFCSFPWVYGTANLLLTWKPIQASAQGPIQSWFCGSLLALCFLPTAVAALYALIPRILGGHLHRSDLATLGFWMLLLLGGWSGSARLIGGPVPVWMTSTGVVAGILFIIPVSIIAINLLGTMRRCTPQADHFLSYRFLTMGLYSLIVLGVLCILCSIPTVSGALNLTGFTEAKYQLCLLGVVSFPLFGVLYLALPGLIGRHGWCDTLIERHYWLTFTGLWLLFCLMILDGLFTGLALDDPAITFINITSYAYPFHLLECVATLFLLAAVVTLGVNFTVTLAGDYLFPEN